MAENISRKHHPVSEHTIFRQPAQPYSSVQHLLRCCQYLRWYSNVLNMSERYTRDEWQLLTDHDCHEGKHGDGTAGVATGLDEDGQAAGEAKESQCTVR